MVTIVFSVSDFFVPYFAVCLQSLSDVISCEKQYKLFVLEKGISKTNKLLLSNMVCNTSIDLEFLNVRKLMEDKCFYAHDHVSQETFYKLFLPKLFSDYKKVLFCDADIVFQDDPAKLFDIDIGNNKIAVAPCNLWQGIIQKDFIAYEYTINQLGIDDINSYFQAGIVLFNVDKITDEDIEKMEYLAEEKEFLCMDQDILNIVFKNDKFLLESCWNYETSQKTFRDISIPYMTDEIKNRWEKARDNAKIIHYSGKEKPWFYPDEEFADIWWQIAERTPFYESLKLRLDSFQIIDCEMKQLRREFVKLHFPNIDNRFTANEYNTKLLYVLAHTRQFKLKKAWFGFKKAFAFGKRHEKYQAKYDNIKQLLKDARKFKKQMMKV